jgi:hypothetical protein
MGWICVDITVSFVDKILQIYLNLWYSTWMIVYRAKLELKRQCSNLEGDLCGGALWSHLQNLISTRHKPHFYMVPCGPFYKIHKYKAPARLFVVPCTRQKPDTHLYLFLLDWTSLSGGGNPVIAN